jgi:thioredoxin
MPATIDQEKCSDCAFCFPARRCPNGAITYDQVSGSAVIDDTRCGDCPGACTNFCDKYAIRYNPDQREFELIKGELAGDLTPDEIAEARLEMQKQKKAEEDAVIEVNSANFESEVIGSDLPVVVDFWATWCEPCQQMAPVYEQLAQQYSGAMKFAKLDVDKDPTIAQQFNVTNIPTTIFFYRGQPVDGVVGAMSAQQLQGQVYNVLMAIRTLEEPEGEEEL